MSDVTVRIGVDNNGLKRGLDDAKKSVGSFSNDATSKLKAFGAAFVASLSAGAILEFGRSLLGMAKHLRETSDNLDTTAEAVQRLSYVMDKRAGLGAEASEKAMTKFATRLEEARAGSIEAVEAFNRLGISWEDLQRHPLDKLFYRVVSALKDVQDPIATAKDMFGKIVGMSKESAEALEELGKQATVMTDKQIDNWTKLEQKIEKVWSKLKKLAADVLMHQDGTGENEPDRLKKAARKGAEDSGFPQERTKEELADMFNKAKPEHEKGEELPPDPLLAEQAKKDREASDKEAKAAFETERECMLAEIELSKKATEEKAKADEKAAREFEKQKAAETAAYKQELASQLSAAQTTAANINAARQQAINNYLQTPEQKRAAKAEKRKRDRAEATLEAREEQKKRDRSNRENGVDPDVPAPWSKQEGPPMPRFKNPDPRKPGPPPEPKEKAKPSDKMPGDIAAIRQSINNLEQKISVG